MQEACTDFNNLKTKTMSERSNNNKMRLRRKEKEIAEKNAKRIEYQKKKKDAETKKAPE